MSASTDINGASDGSALASFLRYLEEHYVSRHARNLDGAVGTKIAFSLALGIASLERDDLRRRFPGLLPQVVLLGPTQAGKSSSVNWLLGQNVAEVSPLAGFTVNLQGFCWGEGTEGTAEALREFFAGLRCVRPDPVDRDNVNSYTLTDLSASAERLPAPAACVWDTPDFDSVDSETYRRNVLRIAALADLIVLVLSKDKYSDQSVWEMVSLLEPLAHPTMIVLNKIEESSRDELVASLTERWLGIRGGALPHVVTFPFVHDEVSLSVASIEEIWKWLRRSLGTLPRPHPRKQTRELLQRHWEIWLAPVRAEQEARNDWVAIIEDAIEESLSCYRRDYLEHPHHYETFQRALASLLTLLEIPGFAGMVSSARRMLTWPWRQLSALGRQLRQGAVEETPSSAEQALLEQLVEHLLLRLEQKALSKRDREATNETWWRDLARLMAEARGNTKAHMRSAVRDYLGSFQTEIDHTARDLYRRLESRPVVLNSLRATRITTDAAALAFALHSGGIGIQDFVIAPATLSLTSMLTESALGRYVNRAVRDLKARQYGAVSKLFRETLGHSLSALPDHLDDEQYFKLSPAAIAKVEDLLAAYG